MSGFPAEVDLQPDVEMKPDMAQDNDVPTSKTKIAPSPAKKRRRR